MTRVLVTAVAMRGGGVCAHDRRTSSTAPIVEFCELVRRSPEFDNTRVLVVSDVVVNFEVFALADNACVTDSRAGGFIWLDTRDEGCDSYEDGWPLQRFVQAAMAGTLAEDLEVAEWRNPMRTTAVPRKGLAAFESATRRAKGRPLPVVVQGRFDFVGEGRVCRGTDRRIRHIGAYGHLNGYSRRLMLEHIWVEEERK